MDSLSEAGQALATYQIDYDEEVGFAALRRLYDLARDADERPFLLVASFIHPHDPYVARPQWWDLYDHDDIDLPEPIPDDALDPHTRASAEASRPTPSATPPTSAATLATATTPTPATSIPGSAGSWECWPRRDASTTP